jgi:hypothetical protein
VSKPKSEKIAMDLRLTFERDGDRVNVAWYDAGTAADYSLLTDEWLAKQVHSFFGGAWRVVDRYGNNGRDGADLERIKSERVGRYSFCEHVLASSSSPWHIRELTTEGKKLTGGIDTSSLCGQIRRGWDLRSSPEDTKLSAPRTVCEACWKIWQKLRLAP